MLINDCTFAAIAALIGMTRQNLWWRLRGHGLNSDEIRLVAKHLGVTEQWLIGDAR